MKLVIPQFQILEEITDKSAADITITLNIYLINNIDKTRYPLSYDLKVRYSLPVMNDIVDVTKISVTPYFGFTLFTDFTF